MLYRISLKKKPVYQNMGPVILILKKNGLMMSLMIMIITPMGVTVLAGLAQRTVILLRKVVQAAYVVR